MLYLSPPSGPEVIAAMERGLLGVMTTPAQGNVLPDGCPAAADCGKFGEGWPGEDVWFAWLTKTVKRYGAGRFLFAVAPDVPFDAEATLAESRPWLPKIRDLGVPAAFVAQNGSDAPGMVPWGEFGVLFLGGGPECLACSYIRPSDDRDQKTCPTCGCKLTEWKESRAAARLAAEAAARGVPRHMGRMSSRRRGVIAAMFGCASADGTYFRFGPDKNLERMLRWLADINEAQLPLSLEAS